MNGNVPVSPPAERRLAAFITALRDLRTAGREFDFQSQIADLLITYGLAFNAEWSLGKDRGRIDFYLPDYWLGLEVKVRGDSFASIVRQLTKYAMCPSIARLVLVTTHAFDGFPTHINEIPLTVVTVWKGQF